jgi:hypothetical protein
MSISIFISRYTGSFLLHFVKEVRRSIWNTPDISAIIPKGRRGENPIVAFVNTTLPTEKQKCDARKKKNPDDDIDNAILEDHLDGGIVSNNNDEELGVNDTVDGDHDVNDLDEGSIPKELKSDLGP